MQMFPHISAIANFLILLLILIVLLRKPLKNFLIQRSQDIETNLQESQKLRDQALAMLEEYEKKIASLDQEVEGILNKAKKDGEKEKQRILQRAEMLAEQIVNNAKQGAQRESERIRKKIENTIMKKALTQAKEDLTKKATVKDHQMFVDYFIERLESKNGSTTTV